MPTPFDRLTAKLAIAALEARIGPLLKSNALYLAGEHWQDSLAWLGPRPLPGEEGAAEMLDRIKLGQVTRNVIAEVTERHQTGVIGWAPLWGMTVRREMEEEEEPSTQEEAAILEVEAALRQWYDRRKVQQHLQTFVRYLLSADAGGSQGRAILRLRLTPAALRTVAGGAALLGTGVQDGDTVVEAPPSLAAALDLFVLEVPDPSNGTVVVDEDTLAECGVVRYEILIPGETKPTPVLELYHLADPAEPAAPGAPAPAAPVTSPAGEGGPAPVAPLTVFRRFEGDKPEQSVRLALGGRLPVFEAPRALFLTRQVQDGQKAVNLCCTMQPLNVTKAGFLATTLFNAQMPGEWEYKDGKPFRFTPGRYRAGAGTLNFVRGLTYKDESGRTVLATPSIHESPPVDTRPTREAKRDHYQDVLEETDQAHILMSGDATASGKSRETARADYEASLQLTATPTEQAGRWLLETVLALAEVLLGVPGQWTGPLRADFTCRLNVGPATPTELQANDAEQRARRLSRSTAMGRNGIMDVEAELGRIEAEEGTKIEYGTTVFGALTAASILGLPLELAGRFLDLPEEKLALLREADAALAERRPALGEGDPGAPDGAGANGRRAEADEDDEDDEAEDAPPRRLPARARR